MVVTRESLVVALRRVGLVASVQEGWFDKLMEDESTKLIVIQYSEDGSTNWSSDLDTAVHSFWRWSTDGGVTYTSDGVRFKAEGGFDFSEDISQLKAKDIEFEGLINLISDKADSVANNNIVLDQRVTTIENKPAGTDYSSQINALQSKDTTQDTRLTGIDASLLNKAPLVSGKVPYENLPEFPVGRKVNVTNRAARLGLSTYTDLTIAYQSDTGDAWGLDANDDPAIDSNWSMLGNAQALGVVSFNGRTGQIGPMAGDYNTGQVTELVDKRFVTQAQIEDWGSRETVAASQAKSNSAQTTAISSAKTYADTTFIPLTQKGANNGVAPLGASGKVPVERLPTNVAGGVPVLDANNRVPSSMLYRDSANGLAPLDANRKVPLANLPSGFGSRIWRTPTRTLNTWYTNSTGQEMVIHYKTPWTTTVGTRARVRMRDTEAGTIIDFDGVSIQATGLNYWSSVDAIVPIGWQYNISPISATRAEQYAELSE